MARGSESRKRFTRDNDLTSSVHEVLSNDDLLMEILLRLPRLSLYFFKQVCKRWLSLITSSSFTLTRTRTPTIDPPSGLFVGRKPVLSFGNPKKYDFVSFDPRIPSKYSIEFSFNSKADTMNVESSCNGLLLCCIPRHGNYICNPLTSMFKMLPPMHDPLNNYHTRSVYEMKMAFDPIKSPHYKVVHVESVKDNDGYSIRIQTYSSETGVWSVWDDRFPYESFFDFCDGIYWNGAIHWLKSRKPFHVKLDIVDHPVLTNIQTPLPKMQLLSNRKLFNSHSSLLLLCKEYPSSRYLSIYEMNNGNSEWLKKYFVNLEHMMRTFCPFPDWRIPRMPDNWDCYHILSIFLGEREEESFMVFELAEQVLQYKFASETVTKLLVLGLGFHRRDCQEFIASFAHV